MNPYEGDPDLFVRENQDLLVRLLKHGDDCFVRALALAILERYGNEPQMEDVLREIELSRRKDTRDR
jgi:hypothetical protein